METETGEIEPLLQDQTDEPKSDPDPDPENREDESPRSRDPIVPTRQGSDRCVRVELGRVGPEPTGGPRNTG
ncbi:hypothetical protein GQ457_07G022140 [Hibiscus cannabinus]